MSAKAKKIWVDIVDDRPTDYFRPGSLLLLEQLCSTMVAQREILAQLERSPEDRRPDQGCRGLRQHHQHDRHEVSAERAERCRSEERTDR